MVIDRRPRPVGDRPPSHRRLTAAAAVHGLTISALAGRVGVSDVHLRAVAAGERRASARLVEALMLELGDGGWEFVCGATDTLRMPSKTEGRDSEADDAK